MTDENPCCGFKKKTVVMTCMAICCLALVAWTIIITANPLVEGAAKTIVNSTDTSANSSFCTFNSSEPIEQVKLILLRDGGNSITRKNIMHRIEGKTAPICKCFCKLNITEEMLLEAVRFLRLNSVVPGSTDPLYNPKAGLTSDPGIAPESHQPGASNAMANLAANDEQILNSGI